MKTEDGREWFDGDDPNNFAAAAKKAVENAEDGVHVDAVRSSRSCTTFNCKSKHTGR